MVDLVQTPDWRLAVVFDRHPFHQLGCDSDWGRISHLVDRRTQYVALATLWNFSARVASVHHSRELGKKESETELSANQQKASSRIATVNGVLSLLADTGTHLSAFTRHLGEGPPKLFDWTVLPSAVTRCVAFPALLGYYCPNEKLKILADDCFFASRVCLCASHGVAWACIGADEWDFFRYCR